MLDNMDRIRSARIFTDLVADVKFGEEVLVLVDTETIQTGELLATTARATGADVILAIYSGERFHGEEPFKTITYAMTGSDVCLTTIHGLGHTLAVKKARAAGMRGPYLVREPSDVQAVLYGDTTTRGLVTKRTGPSIDLTLEDLNEIRKRNQKLVNVLKTGKMVSITTPGGADITFSIEGRSPLNLGPFEGKSWDMVDWSVYPKIPNWLGQAEVALAPVTGTAEGIYVVDGQMEGVGLVDEPIRWIVKEGRAVEITGGRSAQVLKGILSAADENANNIGEFGIGTNHKIKMQVGDKLDKGQYGTVHLALGFQIFEGGTKGEVISNVHMDGIALDATIIIDEKIVMKDGVLKI